MTESSTLKGHGRLEDSIPQASLESILCTEELHRRPWRLPDYEKENHALVALANALADSPRTVLQTLAETILDITQSDSAGLSLLTKDGKTPDVSGTRFYWPAIAGMWSPHVGGGTPRNFGPCGDVLDQNRTLLFRHFERRYPCLLPVMPAAEECLLVPFHVRGIAVGTIWAIKHNHHPKFDAEDDRVMASLGKFASSAYQALVSIDDLKFQVAEIEQERLELSGRLIKAQEEERRHLARELHDDFAQRMALLGIDVQHILDAIGNSQPNASEQIRDLLKTVNEIGNDVHSLSHDLHSSKLEILGLSKSVGCFCREFSKQHEIQIDFDKADLHEPIPSEAALCLFRIVQEGLQNAHKHSRASGVEVRLTGSPREITLILSGNGVGFDLSQNYASSGIGILSMKERARMLDGTCEIRSAPMKGTLITVKIPLNHVHAAA